VKAASWEAMNPSYLSPISHILAQNENANYPPQIVLGDKYHYHSKKTKYPTNMQDRK
jgi:hypothetical protein